MNDVVVPEFAVESEASSKQLTEEDQKEFNLVNIKVNKSAALTTESTGEKTKETMSQKSIG